MSYQKTKKFVTLIAHFQERVLYDIKFKLWFVKDKSNFEICQFKICNVQLKCGKCELEKHSSLQ